jgi:hypothetical protein
MEKVMKVIVRDLPSMRLREPAWLTARHWAALRVDQAKLEDFKRLQTNKHM